MPTLPDAAKAAPSGAALATPIVLVPYELASLARLGTGAWGLSSAGRAVALQASGHRFDPDRLHQAPIRSFEHCVILDEEKRFPVAIRG